VDLHVRCLEAPNIFSQMAVKIGDLPWYKVKSLLKLIQVMRDYQYLPTWINSLVRFQTGNASANLVSIIWDEHSRLNYRNSERGGYMSPAKLSYFTNLNSYLLRCGRVTSLPQHGFRIKG